MTDCKNHPGQVQSLRHVIKKTLIGVQHTDCLVSYLFHSNKHDGSNRFIDFFLFTF